MPDDPRQPLSSEEMIRRARRGPDHDSAEQLVLEVREELEPDSEAPVSQDDFVLPSYAAVQREAAAMRRQAAEQHQPAAPSPEPAEADADDDPTTSSRQDSAPEAEGDQPQANFEEPQTEFEDIFGPIHGTATAKGDGPLEKTPRGSRFKLSWLRWVIAAAVVGFAMLRFFDSSTPVDRLEAGQCFDDPGATEIYRVDLIDCNDLHDFEIYALVDLQGDSGAFPGDDPLFEELSKKCFDRFEGYVGKEYATSRYDFSGLTPLEDGWEAGDRQGICLLYRYDADGVQQKSSSAANSGV